MDHRTKEKYLYWIQSLQSISKEDYIALSSIEDDKTITDLFYKDLTFGTGGLRGVMGIGSNRLNPYTIYKATHGLSLYLKQNNPTPKVVIGYDSRNHSREYAVLSARVFANLGLEVYLFPELIPTPVVSYAIRYLHADAGIIITASHNPREYNGYKVYNERGSQITQEAADAITALIESVDPFQDYMECTKEDENQRIHEIDDTLIDDFIQSTLQVSLLKDFSKKDVNIVYTPLNGTGLKPVLRVLKCAGFDQVIVPEAQKNPDGNFPTCPYPNPELKDALQLGIQTCKETHSELLLATDPDCDRCGIGVQYHDDFLLLTGNEVAILLLNFFVETEDCNGKELVRSIVSTSFVDRIAKEHHIRVKKVLTGFKYIGEEINLLEDTGRKSDFLFGFEESYGYLTNTEVRDKDAVNASLIISEMFYYYKKRNINLVDKLHEIFRKYGFCKNKLLSHTFQGQDGMNSMRRIMSSLRSKSFEQLSSCFGEKVTSVEDYLLGRETFLSGESKAISLPKSDVLILCFENGSRLAIRPSGTEPKLKCYIEALSKDEQDVIASLASYETRFYHLLEEETHNE